MGPFRKCNGSGNRSSQGTQSDVQKYYHVQFVVHQELNLHKDPKIKNINVSSIPVFIKLLSTSDGHVEITSSRTIADPHADRGEEGDAQPEQEEKLQVEVSVHVRNRPRRHDDKRGPQVLNGLQEIRTIIPQSADPSPPPSPTDSEGR
jgi:hypothetical protein